MAGEGTFCYCHSQAHHESAEKQGVGHPLFLSFNLLFMKFVTESLSPFTSDERRRVRPTSAAAKMPEARMNLSSGKVLLVVTQLVVYEQNCGF
jgi:hypothetical protein